MARRERDDRGSRRRGEGARRLPGFPPLPAVADGAPDDPARRPAPRRARRRLRRLLPPQHPDRLRGRQRPDLPALRHRAHGHLLQHPPGQARTDPGPRQAGSGLELRPVRGGRTVGGPSPRGHDRDVRRPDDDGPLPVPVLRGWRPVRQRRPADVHGVGERRQPADPRPADPPAAPAPHGAHRRSAGPRDAGGVVRARQAGHARGDPPAGAAAATAGESRLRRDAGADPQHVRHHRRPVRDLHLTPPARRRHRRGLPGLRELACGARRGGVGGLPAAGQPDRGALRRLPAAGTPAPAFGGVHVQREEPGLRAAAAPVGRPRDRGRPAPRGADGRPAVRRTATLAADRPGLTSGARPASVGPLSVGPRQSAPSQLAPSQLAPPSASASSSAG